MYRMQIWRILAFVRDANLPKHMIHISKAGSKSGCSYLSACDKREVCVERHIDELRLIHTSEFSVVIASRK